MPPPAFNPRLISVRLRLAEVLQSNPGRSAGELDKSAIGLVHFEDQIDRTGHCQRSGEKHGGYAGVAWGKKAEARENYDEPTIETGEPLPDSRLRRFITSNSSRSTKKVRTKGPVFHHLAEARNANMGALVGILGLTSALLPAPKPMIAISRRVRSGMFRPQYSLGAAALGVLPASQPKGGGAAPGISLSAKICRGG